MKYGVYREFVEPHNDWKKARRSWSGNVYGRIAYFAVRDGLYEVGRYRGSGKKQRFVREYIRVANGEKEEIDAVDVLDEIDGIDGEAVTYEATGRVTVARVVGLGENVPIAWLSRDEDRVFRLAYGSLYVVTREDGEPQIVEVVDGDVVKRTQREALLWLSIRMG